MIDTTLTTSRKGLSLEKKIERALNTMPWEIIVQYSRATDSIDVLERYAKLEAIEENKTLLEVLYQYSIETLETYECELLGHINYFMQFEHEEYGTWKRERNEVKSYIKKLQGYLKSEGIK